jgi:hypothetical protein
MALSATLSLTDNFGENITFKNTYIKVVEISGTKDILFATYSIYKQKPTSDVKLTMQMLLENRNITFSLDLEGPNPIKQAYQFLKSLPEFADAVDC